MPKKTGLATATKPPVDPEKWVTDTTPPSIPAGPIARMTVELPLEMHRELKGKCGREGLKIKQVIIALVQDYLAGKIKIAEEHLR
jgi:ParG protein